MAADRVVVEAGADDDVDDVSLWVDHDGDMFGTCDKCGRSWETDSTIGAVVGAALEHKRECLIYRRGVPL